MALDRYDGAFLTAAAISLDLLTAPAVAARWRDPSALPELSVGALACHLGRQTVLAAQLLTDPTPLPPMIDADEHYAVAPWVEAEERINDHTAVDAEAAQGPTAARQRTRDALETVRTVLGAGAAMDVVPQPWLGRSLPRDGFLLTRMVEIVTHADDLAVSVDVSTPTFPPPVFDPVVALLVRLAVRKHGQGAVVGTLTRRERTRAISAF